MNIKEFSYNLQKLYNEMTDSFSSFQKTTGWNCLPSCGRCCLNPEVEASLFEMIPMALAIYEEGKIDEWLEKLSSSERNYCYAFIHGNKDGEGKCGRYNERPSLCRMFSVAGHFNKQHEVTLSICKYIKEAYQIEDFSEALKNGNIPMMVEWSYKLASLDQRLITDRMPINKALEKALEKVALYAQYQNL